MMQDAAEIQQSLVEWILSRSNSGSNDDLSKALMSDAIISDDGATLTLSPDNIVFDTRIKLSVPSTTANDTKTDPSAAVTAATTSGNCEYSVGAIYLQIRNPKQSLIVYRNDCKKYNVSDPIKAIDKSSIVNYFLPLSFLVQHLDSAIEPNAIENKVATTTTNTSIKPELIDGGTEPATISARRHDKSKSERTSSSKKHRSESRDSSRHGSKSQRASSGSDRKRKEGAVPPVGTTEPSSQKKKKKPDLVTNEQLFEHLNVVVDKRSVASQNNELLANVITKALSAHGFEITNPTVQLIPYQERTNAILQNEIPVGNSSSILRANNPRKNLSRVLELYMETINPPKASQQSNSKGKVSSKVSSKGGGGSSSTSTWKSYLVGKKPVIVVPKGMTAPITIVNAHEFLCHGRYVPRTQMLQQLGSTNNKNPPTTFTRTVATVDSAGNNPSSGGSHTTGLLEYEIIDNPCKLGNNPKEWERIVAVIVLGQSWQFKDWMKGPIAYNIPASLFNSVYGYYINMEGDQISNMQEVQQWAVKKSQLNRDKRGLDSVTYASFWNELDEWMRVYKAELLPQSG